MDGTAALLARARAGDRRAREQLVTRYAGLVRSVASRYRNLGLPLDDLVQEGSLGLLAAIDELDPERSASFGGYAYWRVRRAVTAALTADGRLLRLPRSLLERRRVVAGARARLAAGGHEPAVSDLAAATGLSARAVVEALAPPPAVVSLDAPLPGGTSLEELVEDETAVDPHAEAVLDEQRRLVDEAVSRLPERTRYVLGRHLGLVRERESLASIAAELGLTTERVRTIESRALCTLAHELEPALRRER